MLFVHERPTPPPVHTGYHHCLAAPRHQRLRRAAPKHTGRGDTGGGDVIHLLHKNARRVFFPEQDGAWRHEIHEGGTKAAGKTHTHAGPFAGADQIEIGAAINLPTTQKEQINPRKTQKLRVTTLETTTILLPMMYAKWIPT